MADEKPKAPPARTPMEVLQRMNGQQAGIIARLTSALEEVPALEAELAVLRAEVERLKKLASPQED